MQLVWADYVAKYTGKPVLIIGLLSFLEQSILEAEKFGIECSKLFKSSVPNEPKIYITNYEQIDNIQDVIALAV